MSRDLYTQCLLLVAHQVKKCRRSSRRPTSSDLSTAKAYALLPDIFRKEHLDVVNLFQRNDICVLNNENMSFLPFVENEKLVIIEILLDGSSATSLDPLLIFGARTNREVVQLFFGSVKLLFKTEPSEGKVCPAVDDTNMNVMKWLLSQEVTIHCRHSAGENLLHVAAERGPESLVRLVLEHGVDVNIQRSDGCTPLHLAASQGLCEVVETLLQNGADPNTETKALKKTAVLLAAENGEVDVVEVLWKYGAKLDVKNGVCCSILALAFKKEQPCVLQYFLDCYYLDVLALKEDSIMAVFLSSDEADFLSFLDSDSDVLCFAAVVMHFIKLFALNFNNVVGQLQLPTFETVQNETMKDFKAKCDLEVDRMRKQTLGNTDLSFYDVLSKGTSEVACILRNDSVAEIAVSEDLNIQFPIYGYMLRHHFRKGRERKLLLEDGIKVCRSLFSHFKKLPYELKEKILSHLTIRDLLILKNVFAPPKI